MISEKLLQLFNEQIKHEYDSRNVYFGMESYLRDEDWDGFAEFFRVQAEEEMIHCRYFMEYLSFIGEKWEMLPLDGQKNEYESVLDVFENGLKHEKFITDKIHRLYDQAVEDKDYFAMKFLDWYVKEQAEEENNFNTWISRIKRAETGSGLTILDQEAGARTLVVPANPPIHL